MSTPLTNPNRIPHDIQHKNMQCLCTTWDRSLSVLNLVISCTIRTIAKCGLCRYLYSLVF